MAVPHYTRDRDRVSKLAASQPEEALKIARGIDEPWFLCQALAFVAYRCSDLAKKNRLLAESFAAALETQEPNRVVSVSSWPLKVLCKSGQGDKLQKEAERLLGIIGQEPSPVRRADALNDMLGAVLSGPRPLFWHVFDRFEQACLTPLLNGKRNAKGESRMAHWAVVIDHFDPARAQQLVQSLQGPVLREQAFRSLQQNKNIEPERWVGWPYVD